MNSMDIDFKVDDSGCLTIVGYDKIYKKFLTGEIQLSDNDLINWSIKKWKVLAYRAMMGNAVREGGRWSCALCLMYNNQFNCKRLPPYKSRFKRCPIFRRTNKLGCANTPYEEYPVISPGYYPDEAFSAAKKEIRFLRSLLK